MGNKVVAMSALLIGIVFSLALFNIAFLINKDNSAADSSAKQIDLLALEEKPEGTSPNYIDEIQTGENVITTPIPNNLLEKWVDITTLPQYNMLPLNDKNSSNVISSFTSYSVNWGEGQLEYLTRDGIIWRRSRGLKFDWTTWHTLPSVYGVGTNTKNKVTGVDFHRRDVSDVHYTSNGRIFYSAFASNATTVPPYTDVTKNVKGVGRGKITNFSQTRLLPDYSSAQYLTRNGQVYFRVNSSGWSTWKNITDSFKNVDPQNKSKITAYDTAILSREYTQSYLTKGGKVYTRFTKYEQNNNPK